ncbi:MAG: metallopeptidase TldD-related protein [Odoribacter sp.]
MMKNNKLFVLLVSALLLTQLVLTAQPMEDKVVMSAMHDELLRNKQELSLANFSTPFFLSYAVNISSGFEISASLGAVVNSYQDPLSVAGTIRLMLGDNHRTSDIGYNGQYQSFPLPAEADYNEIRRCFWLATDAAYKQELRKYVSKNAYLKANPRTPEEEGLDDFSKTAVTSNQVTSDVEYQMDKKEWETKLADLSAIFKKYPQLFNSSVTLEGQNMSICKETSEGITLKEPKSYAFLSVRASVIANDGVKISDDWSKVALRPQDLPTLEVLEKEITAFADNLVRLGTLEPCREYYSGPVLFEDGACSNIFVDNLLQPGRLMAYRKAEGGKPEFTLDSRMGRKILDHRISVRNYTALKSYNNTSLFGSYTVDAEGVTPAKEMTLIEEGIFKGQLNGRIPTLKALQSTGSSRFALANDQVYFGTAPGTIHILVKDGMKPEKMKKALQKAAHEEGLDYAYIVRKMAGQASRIYRVDVKTGEETQVRAGDFAAIDLPKIKRLREISTKEKVSNYMLNRQSFSSLIYPSAILMEDVEINVPQLKQEKQTALTFPLAR